MRNGASAWGKAIMASFTANGSGIHADAQPPRVSRRALVWHGWVLGVTLASPRTVSAALDAQPSVSVTPPRVIRNAGCLATVSVIVTLTGLVPDVHYILSGVVLEADGGDDAADFCCALDPQTVVVTDPGSHRRHLNRQVVVADLGLLKGLGPARDEDAAQDQVELFARIWLHDLTMPDPFAPRDSPPQVVESRSQEDWAYPRHDGDNPLMVPRGGGSAVDLERAGQPTSLAACAPVNTAGSAVPDARP